MSNHYHRLNAWNAGRVELDETLRWEESPSGEMRVWYAEGYGLTYRLSRDMDGELEYVEVRAAEATP